MTAVSPTLVIGYGNPLRGDDAAGRQLAAALAERFVAQIKSLSVHQLSPDMAADLAEVKRVIFADASCEPGLQSARLEPLMPAAIGGSSHHLHPATLLALTRRLYDSCPEAYLLSLPAQTFDLSESLSELAAQGVKQGLLLVEVLLEE